MTIGELNEILRAVRKHIRARPAWMRKPEHRMREPAGNRDPYWAQRA